MVVNNILSHLMYTGLSEYEAKAYVALLGASPATAYEVAKSSGIPTSKIYEVVSKLEDRGVAMQVEEAGKTKYVPQEPGDFLKLRRHMMETTLGELEDGLGSLSASREASIVWNLYGRGALMERAGAMIEEAGSTLLLSLWSEEAGDLESVITMASERGVRLATVHFGIPSMSAGKVYRHPIQHTLFEEKGGRSMVVVSDGASALVGTAMPGEDGGSGAWSTNRGFVALAEDYVKHDIYMMKVVSRFDRALRERFGEGYEKLRDVFTDEEKP